MERLAFLIEATGQRVFALANPAEVEIRRAAGGAPRTISGRSVVEPGASDAIRLATGGGTTEIDVQLLFDTSLATSMAGTAGTAVEQEEDVRPLSEPLWLLAENDTGRFGPPVVRFIWGSAWNIRCVVSEAAQRFENFSPGGAPSRCWMRLRLVRIPGESEANPGALERGVAPLAGLDELGPDDLGAAFIGPEAPLAGRFDLMATTLGQPVDAFDHILSACEIEDPWSDPPSPLDAAEIHRRLTIGAAPEAALPDAAILRAEAVR